MVERPLVAMIDLQLAPGSSMSITPRIMFEGGLLRPRRNLLVRWGDGLQRFL